MLRIDIVSGNKIHVFPVALVLPVIFIETFGKRFNSAFNS